MRGHHIFIFPLFLVFPQIHIFGSPVPAAPSIISNAPWQYVPTTQTTSDNEYNTGTTRDSGLPALSSQPVSEDYGLRDIDIPFGRVYKGQAKYFMENETNTVGSNTDVWNPGKNDYANQSACGIPNNAYFISHAAIHPYFLQYANLSR